MIELKHKENGFHIVYSDRDAKAYIKLGWKKCDIKKEWAEIRKVKAEKVLEAARIAEQQAIGAATKELEG